MKNLYRLIPTALLLILFTFFSSHASAHVVVKPSEVAVGTFQTFTVGVPNEKDIPTTQISIVLPEGLKHITPNVKPGWEITVNDSSEIIWSGGEIPAGQRDEFLFSAQVPPNEGTLSWKAYQIYADGTVVSWDRDSAQHEDSHEENTGPASTTKIINDLVNQPEKEHSTKPPFRFDVLAFVLSMAALIVALRKK